MLVLCWAFNGVAMLAMAYITVAYSYCFGDQQTCAPESSSQ